MKPRHFFQRGALGLVCFALLLAVGNPASASDRDRRRSVPLPPPPHEVIEDIRGFIHSIGRGIKDASIRIVTSVEEEVDEQRARRGAAPRRLERDEEWDGEFFPDEQDEPRYDPRLRPDYHPRRDPGMQRGPEMYRPEPDLDDEAYGYRPSPPEELHRQPVPPPAMRRESDKFRAAEPKPEESVKEGPAPRQVKPTTPSQTQPKDSTSAAPTQPAAPTLSQVPFASPVPGKKGLVYPPGVEKKPENMVDVSDFQPGQLVRNPRNGELFRVP